MPKSNLKSVRTSLIFLTILIFIPLLVIILYSSGQQKRKSYWRVEKYAENQAVRITDELTQTQGFIRQSLWALCQIPELKKKDADTARWNRYFRSLNRRNILFSTIQWVKLNDTDDTPEVYNATLHRLGLESLRKTLNGKSLIWGISQKDPTSMESEFWYCCPVLSQSGEMVSVVIATMDWSYFDSILKGTHSDLPFSYIITDQHHIVQYQSGYLGMEVGKTLFLTPEMGKLGRLRSSTLRTRLSDGKEFLVGYKQLKVSEQNYYNIYAGVPETMALAGFYSVFHHDLLIWAIALIVILGSIYVISLKYIIHPIEQLVRFAEQVADGNYQNRPEIANSSKEFSKLSVAIESMIDKLLLRNDDQKKVEKDLKKLKERFELAANSAKIGIWDWHIRTDGLIWDRNMIELYGVLPDHFGANMEAWKCLIFEEDQDRFNEHIDKALEIHRPFNGEYRIVHPITGIKTVEIFASVIEDKHGNPARLIGVNWDISERKILENKLSEAKDHAERNDRLKSVFFADISHEIRTPLHGIIGFAQILRDHDITYQERLQYLDIIMNNGNKLLNVISNIIDVSLIDGGQMKLMLKEHNVNALIYEIFDFYEKIRVKENKQFQLKLAVDSDKPLMMDLDYFRFNQIYSNLLNLIYKFNECGEIHIGYKLSPGDLCCFIKDYGGGLNEEQVTRIFDRFRKNSETGNGKYSENGLELLICKGLVELMGGTIWANFTDSVTEIYFNLPLKMDDELLINEDQYNSTNYKV